MLPWARTFQWGSDLFLHKPKPETTPQTPVQSLWMRRRGESTPKFCLSHPGASSLAQKGNEWRACKDCCLFIQSASALWSKTASDRNGQHPGLSHSPGAAGLTQRHDWGLWCPSRASLLLCPFVLAPGGRRWCAHVAGWCCGEQRVFKAPSDPSGLESARDEPNASWGGSIFGCRTVGMGLQAASCWQGFGGIIISGIL